MNANYYSIRSQADSKLAEMVRSSEPPKDVASSFSRIASNRQSMAKNETNQWPTPLFNALHMVPHSG